MAASRSSRVCKQLTLALARAGELFVRKLVQRSAMRLASDIAPPRNGDRKPTWCPTLDGQAPSHTHSVGRVGGRVLPVDGHTRAPVNGVARYSPNGFPGDPTGSDGMASEPASTAALQQPRAVLASMRKDRSAWARL